MSPAAVRALGVAVLAALLLLPALALRMTALANHGAHSLTSGFGRGRLDRQGIVSEGAGTIRLPREPLALTLRLSSPGTVRILGEGVSQTAEPSETPREVRLDVPGGGEVRVQSDSRIRLHEIAIERKTRPAAQIGLILVAGFIAALFASRSAKAAVVSAAILLAASAAVAANTLSFVFARIAIVQLAPLAASILLFAPLILGFRAASFRALRPVSPLSVAAFFAVLTLSAAQFALFESPQPLGDPGAYLEMGREFGDALTGINSPLGLGPVLSNLQPYLALPATGLLYGLLTLAGGLVSIYAAQAVAMAIAVGAVVSICESEMGPRVARIALAIALLHPTVAVLPSLVQPEPFILAAWTMAARLALHSLRERGDVRGLLGAGLLFGLGLALHPQGLSFLLLAFVLCLAPWTKAILGRPSFPAAVALGIFSLLLPVAAAEHFASPLAHVLDKKYGFFAYTSPHPLGFWLYTDSSGWQGPLRIEDTTYQKELFAAKGQAAVSSTFADVAAFVARHPGRSIETVLTNLHRLWHRPDNPFAVPFLLPEALQAPFHRGLIVLFVVALPAWFAGRSALLALPFVMLSMTYPAYHVFNKYATPALPFTIIGAAFALDLILRERRRALVLVLGLTLAAAGAVLPAAVFARAGVPGFVFMPIAWASLWIGLAVSLARAAQTLGVDARSRLLGAAVGLTVLIASSLAASRSDTARGEWSAPLDSAFEVSCRPPEGARTGDSSLPAWLFIDIQSRGAIPPRIEVNGQTLEPPVPTMPVFGLATTRGHLDPTTFRQLWRVRLSEDLLKTPDLKVRVSGGQDARIFGDIRAGRDGPRLSLGLWPHLSVYRLMHEGQYRLPTQEVAPPQACFAPSISGRPGVFLVRIPDGDEARVAVPPAKPVVWVY